MLVSAVIPSFNRRDYLPRAIESVLAQTVPVDEILLIDDGSNDGSAEYVQSKYGKGVRVVRQENSGVSGARRRGIEEARGEWIAFLDSDDEWSPDRNGELLRAAEYVPSDVAWIFGDLRLVTDRGEGLTLFDEHDLHLDACPKVFADPFSVHYPFMFPMLQSSLIRRNVLLNLQCFREGLRSSEDLLAAYQVACHYKFAAVPTVVGRYFRTSDLASSSLMVGGVFNADYYRSRMMAFACVINSGRKRPWNARYASEVRGLCRVLARQDRAVRSLALRQFRYGDVSVKGIAFLGAALLGPWALRIWEQMGTLRRRHLPGPVAPVKQNGLQAYFQSVGKKPRSAVVHGNEKTVSHGK